MMTLQQAAQGIQAAYIVGDVQIAFRRVCTDSRQVAAGDLFVALRGERFDGHGFVAAAFAAGAAAVMVDAAYVGTAKNALLVVPDTEKALGELAKYWRNQQRVTVFALTGSSGKTTVKELLATVLRDHFGKEAVLATQGNYNNHIGVPLTLLSLRAQHRFAVVEMGMNHQGEIHYLTHLARPDVALVNNAQAAHLEALGSVEGVAHAKAEIFEGLHDAGIAVLNADDAQVDVYRATPHTQLEFGLQNAAIHAIDIHLAPLHSEFTLVLPESKAKVSLPAPGLHNIQNALAAATMASTLGLSAQEIAQGLAQFKGVKGRLNQQYAANGAVLIDDTYNANPASIKAAIDVLAQFSAPRLLILGDMGEMGTEDAKWHCEIGEYAKEKGIECLLTLGEKMQMAAATFGGQHFTSIDALLIRAQTIITPLSTILVKGSRFMQMERIVKRLQGK